MFLECAASCAVGILDCLNQEFAAALLMVIRHIGNGVERLEHCAPAYPGGLRVGYVALPDPLPASVADFVVAAGESADGAAGWCRAVTDDVTELVIECGVSQGGD